MKICLVGTARSGKDTVANLFTQLLWDEENRMPKTMAFGDAMRLYFHHMFRDIYHYPKPVEEYRTFAQSCREVDPEIWIKHLEARYLAFGMRYEDFIISDCRQFNEAQWAKDNGFILVGVRSKDFDIECRARELGEDAPAPCEAEEHTHDIICDYYIWNYGTLDDLQKDVKEIYEEIRGNEFGKLRGNVTEVAEPIGRKTS